ncbi:hypothetical protein lerEdw1_007644, partial [Lerista edwardsae]
TAGPSVEYSCFAEQAGCCAINSFRVQVRPLGDEPRSNGSAGGCPKRFPFSTHFKPHPPLNLTAEASREGYNISWRTKYQHSGSHLDGKLQYELRYRQRGRPWQGQGQKKRLLQDTRTLRLLPHELEGGAEYEVQVRAGPGQQAQAGHYKGTWSEWSPPARLRTLPGAPEGREDARWLVPLLLLLLLGSLAIAVVFRGCHQRLWKKLDVFIPSPAPFFQPLYLAHRGDFKAWAGTSCARATLDILEWGPVLPEAVRVGPGHPPPSPAKGGRALPLEPALPPLPGPPQAPPPPDGSGRAPEQSYGLLSIDTVTVAGVPTGGGCPHGSGASLCSALEQWPEEEDAYRGLDLDGDGGAEGQAPGGLLLQDVLPQSPSGPPGPEPLGSSSPPVLLQAGCALGRTAKGGGAFFGWPLEPWGVGAPLGLSSPGSERLSYGDLPSPDGEADGDPGTGLDLDTIDSGFADSDCTSPVDCELEGGPSGCGAELGTGDGEELREAFLPSYVKQWVSGHSRTQPS